MDPVCLVGQALLDVSLPQFGQPHLLSRHLGLATRVGAAGLAGVRGWREMAHFQARQMPNRLTLRPAPFVFLRAAM